MSRIYQMTDNSEAVVEYIEANRSRLGLEIVVNDDPETLWPIGIKDWSGNLGWFEGDLLLFWGGVDETRILETINHKTPYSVSYLG